MLRHPVGMGRDAVSMMEILIVLAILGILFSISISARTDDAGRTARDMARLFTQARFEAVKREAPVAVVWNDDDSVRRLEVRAGVATCADAGTLVRTLDASDRRVRSVSVGLDGAGLIWLPSNIARTCSNDVFTGTGNESRVVVEGRRSTFEVTISPAGFVEVQ